MSTITYLALGDSYTLGEQVLLKDSFPYQLIQLLRKNDDNKTSEALNFSAPEILAKTGWTTGELIHATNDYTFLDKYNFVSLLVGVNNQYRGEDINVFENEFNHLLKLAIKLTGNKPQNVFVLSIPDWGVTPFASGRDLQKIARDIDAFNKVCENGCLTRGARFFDITSSQRKEGHDPLMIAHDGLHPSEREYGKWANLLLKEITDRGMQNHFS